MVGKRATVSNYSRHLLIISLSVSDSQTECGTGYTDADLKFLTQAAGLYSEVQNLVA
jgi:hypothetical protein